VSFILLVILSPVMVIAAVCVRLGSEGPVIYRAQRVGRGGKVFSLYKFRTMRPDADKSGQGITTANDERVTGVGKWFRKLKVDELPQLVNVLKGDMSLVGPRPEDPRYVALYTEQQKRVLDVKPGITSEASVRYRSEEEMLAGADWETAYVNTIMPDKLRIELEYLEHRTLWSDLRVLWRTAVCVFRPRDKAEEKTS